ncbi:MAG TPA: hypothetical protein VKI00_09510 [Mycobacterium sp.]|uniref:hypothetical protein n=1 Tax=Mycobacterium sp. TaxID=1785 RepID=UPI002C0FA81E|nr:hypothetical protein [Mycobacterium sp.]HME75869.1 hypothetical protein [Mycobacterium sp.]
MSLNAALNDDASVFAGAPDQPPILGTAGFDIAVIDSAITAITSVDPTNHRRRPRPF